MIRCGHVQIQNLQEQIIRLSFEILAGNSLILLDSATTPFLALTRNVPVIRFQLPSPITCDPRTAWDRVKARQCCFSFEKQTKQTNIRFLKGEIQSNFSRSGNVEKYSKVSATYPKKARRLRRSARWWRDFPPAVPRTKGSVFLTRDLGKSLVSFLCLRWES